MVFHQLNSLYFSLLSRTYLYFCLLSKTKRKVVVFYDVASRDKIQSSWFNGARWKKSSFKE